MTFAELKAEAASIVAAARASGMIAEPEPEVEEPAPPRIKKPRNRRPAQITCKYIHCGKPIFDRLKFQTMCNDECKQAQRRHMRQLGYDPEKARIKRAKRRKNKQSDKLSMRQIRADAKAYRKLMGFPLRKIHSIKNTKAMTPQQLDRILEENKRLKQAMTDMRQNIDQRINSAHCNGKEEVAKCLQELKEITCNESAV